MAKNLTPGPRRRVPRTRGATSGLLLVILGAWGALIPFIGPYFNFSYTPDKAWHWTAARGWLEVAPGAAAVLGGLLLLFSASRSANLFGAWLGIVAGAWFVVGATLAKPWHIGSPGSPAGTGTAVRVLETLALFTLLGVVIVYFAATAFGRLSVVSLRDARAAERREAAALEADRREREAAAAGAGTGVGAAAADAEAHHDATREERREERAERHDGRREAEAGAVGATVGNGNGNGNGVNEPRAYDPNAAQQNAPAVPGHTDPNYRQPAGYQQPGGYGQPQQPQPYQPQGASVPGGATEQQPQQGGRKHGLFHRN